MQLLLILAEDKIRDPESIDRIASAELPDKTLDPRLHENCPVHNDSWAIWCAESEFSIVDFSYPSKHPDIMETVDTKQENYQNQSTDTVEDKNTITSISPKEHV
ncbi:hypothetical protein TNCV_344661 [Trichonephila clavipes]|nr:hypothetical protein TNCV_344661 [Trichonephila clavipes]